MSEGKEFHGELPPASPEQIRALLDGSRFVSDEAIKTCIKVTTPYGAAYAWDRFRAQMSSSRSITGNKESLIMQHVKMLHLAITGGAPIELIPHTLENEAPILICVWRSRYEELRHIPEYQRHDFVVVADIEGEDRSPEETALRLARGQREDDHLHSHAFKGMATEETAVTPEEECKYSISRHFGYMSPEDEAYYNEMMARRVPATDGVMGRRVGSAK